MATKIRLQRFGKKGKPVYHIVAADSRSKRDGRYIENIGLYNPNTNPATIDLNHDKALAKYEAWLEGKAKQIGSVTSAIEKTKADAAAKALSAEKESRAAKEAVILAKNTPEVEETEDAPVEEAPATEEAAAAEETPAAEAPAAEEAAE
jgi:small subunit ribosomal protein S16